LAWNDKSLAAGSKAGEFFSSNIRAGIDRWRGEERQALATEFGSLAAVDARLRFEQWKQEHDKEQNRRGAAQRVSNAEGESDGAHHA
jgi:hypothetical protein